MFKRFIAISLVGVLLMLCGCNRTPDVMTSDITVVDDGKYRTVNVEKYGVSFEIPRKWYIDMNETELDVFCTDGRICMSVYGFMVADYAEDSNYISVWHKQNENTLKDYGNVKKLKHKPQFKSTDKTLETELYSSVIEETNQYNYYIFAEDKKTPKVFLWIAFGGLKSDIEKNFDLLEMIVDSVKFS